jgi:hypothetical protein
MAYDETCADLGRDYLGFVVVRPIPSGHGRGLRGGQVRGLGRSDDAIREHGLQGGACRQGALHALLTGGESRPKDKKKPGERPAGRAIARVDVPDTPRRGSPTWPR